MGPSRKDGPPQGCGVIFHYDKGYLGKSAEQYDQIRAANYQVTVYDPLTNTAKVITVKEMVGMIPDYIKTRDSIRACEAKDP